MTKKKKSFILPMPAEQVCSPISYSRVRGLPGKAFDSFSTVVETEEITELNLFVKMSIFQKNDLTTG